MGRVREKVSNRENSRLRKKMSYEIIFKYFKQKLVAQEELRREAIGAQRAICHVGAYRAIKR